MELLIDRQFKLEVWEVLLKSMRIGEVSRFKVHKDLLHAYPFVSKQYRKYANIAPQHSESPGSCCGLAVNQTTGYTDLDQFQRCPTGLDFVIELVDVQQPDSYEKELWQMDDGEKLESVARFRSEGNDMYSKASYEEAGDKYAKALTLLEQLMLKEKPGEEEWTELDKMKILLQANYSQCKLILKDYYEVIRQSDEIIERDPNNVKAHYRRARAHIELGNWSEAKSDLEMVK